MNWHPLATVVCLVTALFPATPEAHADFYSWDFLSGDFDNVSLTPFGPGAVNLVRPTEKGLRLCLPVGEKTAGVGFATRFQIRGDFEVTMRYRIDGIAKPKDGWGAGPSLYLTTVGEQQPATQLSRLSRKDDREIYSVFRALPIEGERTKLHKHFDANVEHGKLRIARVDSKLTWSVADGFSEDFKVLHEDTFDTADVGLARVSLQQSHPSTGGTIFIEHFSITAENLPYLPSELAQNERIYLPRYTPVPVIRSKAWIGYLICAVCLAVLTAGWFIRRRSNA